MREPSSLDPFESRKLNRSAFLSHLSGESMSDFEAVKHLAVYPPGAILFLERQLSRKVFVLYSGEIKLSISSSGGKRLILKIAKQGDVLGLVATVTGNPYEMTAETLNSCEVAFVHRDDFLWFIAKHSEANNEVVRQMCSSYLDACERLRTLARSSSAPAIGPKIDDRSPLVDQP
jgi:CRP/FNR family transcriptional regulator, cyclic AMP receptor protein